MRRRRHKLTQSPTNRRTTSSNSTSFDINSKSLIELAITKTGNQRTSITFSMPLWSLILAGGLCSMLASAASQAKVSSVFLSRQLPAGPSDQLAAGSWIKQPLQNMHQPHLMSLQQAVNPPIIHHQESPGKLAQVSKLAEQQQQQQQYQARGLAYHKQLPTFKATNSIGQAEPVIQRTSDGKYLVCYHMSENQKRPLDGQSIGASAFVSPSSAERMGGLLVTNELANSASESSPAMIPLASASSFQSSSAMSTSTSNTDISETGNQIRALQATWALGQPNRWPEWQQSHQHRSGTNQLSPATTTTTTSGNVPSSASVVSMMMLMNGPSLSGLARQSPRLPVVSRREEQPPFSNVIFPHLFTASGLGRGASESLLTDHYAYQTLVEPNSGASAAAAAAGGTDKQATNQGQIRVSPYKLPGDFERGAANSGSGFSLTGYQAHHQSSPGALTTSIPWFSANDAAGFIGNGGSGGGNNRYDYLANINSKSSSSSSGTFNNNNNNKNNNGIANNGTNADGQLEDKTTQLVNKQVRQQANQLANISTVPPNQQVYQHHQQQLDPSKLLMMSSSSSVVDLAQNSPSYFSGPLAQSATSGLPLERLDTKSKQFMLPSATSHYLKQGMSGSQLLPMISSFSPAFTGERVHFSNLVGEPRGSQAQHSQLVPDNAANFEQSAPASSSSSSSSSAAAAAAAASSLATSKQVAAFQPSSGPVDQLASYRNSMLHNRFVKGHSLTGSATNQLMISDRQVTGANGLQLEQQHHQQQAALADNLSIQNSYSPPAAGGQATNKLDEVFASATMKASPGLAPSVAPFSAGGLLAASLSTKTNAISSPVAPYTSTSAISTLGAGSSPSSAGSSASTSTSTSTSASSSSSSSSLFSSSSPSPAVAAGAMISSSTSLAASNINISNQVAQIATPASIPYPPHAHHPLDHPGSLAPAPDSNLSKPVPESSPASTLSSFASLPSQTPYNSSPFSTMLDVFGAASQYLMRFRPNSLISPTSMMLNHHLRGQAAAPLPTKATLGWSNVNPSLASIPASINGTNGNGNASNTSISSSSSSSSNSNSGSFSVGSHQALQLLHLEQKQQQSQGAPLVNGLPFASFNSLLQKASPAPTSPFNLNNVGSPSATSSSSLLQYHQQAPASFRDRSSIQTNASGLFSTSNYFSKLSSQSEIHKEDVCGRTIQAPQRRIIGGEGARYGEFPYQVHIKIAKHQCGGALVDRQSIVTAAHCVYHFITRAPVNKLQIVIGAYDIEDEQYQELPPQYFKVNKVKLHPNFRFSASHPDRYDIAILKLDKPVKYTDNVLPVCLPSKGLKYDRMVGTVTGFGKTDPSLSNRYGTRLLQKVDVPIIDNSECERWHRTRGIDLKIFPEMMCAGYEDGLKDACVGDSGGPLVVKTPDGPNGSFRWTLAGITSAGFGCAQSRQPGIYHRVSHTVDWILENLD